MRGDEIRDEELFFAGIGAGLFELLGEILEVVVGGLAHLVKHIGIDVLGGDFEVPSDVMLGQLADILG